METINCEYYVSLEVAELLKEAGFNWKVNHYYFTQNGKTESKSDFRHPAQNYNEPMATMDSKSFEFDVCSRPTLEVAQRWLREVKGIEVNVLCVYINHIKKYSYVVFNGKYQHELIEEGFNTYEEAQEAGEKKALEMILKKGE